MKSALSQDELKAEVTKYRKELDSQREKNLETLQHLTGLRDQLSRSEKALDEAISNQSQVYRLFVSYSQSCSYRAI